MTDEGFTGFGRFKVHTFKSGRSQPEGICRKQHAPCAEEDSSEADCGEGDIRIETAEYTINQPVRKVLADIYRQDAEIIMFSCYIWNISFVESLLRNLAVIMPAAEIWLGGPEVSFDGERLMSDAWKSARHHGGRGRSDICTAA